jgi:putative membrane-bound dehydrogenase-like protein
VAGHDRITILEDVDGDGSFKKHTTFLDGLNIATSALPGRGGRGPDDSGVWVMNPPYLLFYPDKKHRDVPDGDPIVHLSGFGLEDTHAVASNLTWGPDGWLYGTQGSTCTAKVKAELSGETKTTDFLGQAIWRYHPETHRFEIFAEGGGNTFGLEFDDAGRAYSGTNWGKYRGLHYVQGGYYVKSWGKHGPLTNPYAFGYFEHMPHEGNADRLSHTYIVYGGGLLTQYLGKIISPNPLQSRIQVTRLEPNGSSYKTVEEPFMATCDDGWFRPVDLKAGPDGAIYIADFYEQRITHVDPRDTWDRSTGRIFRIRPANWKPGLKPFDLNAMSSADLVEKLDSINRWDRNQVRQILSQRRDMTVAPRLRQFLVQDYQQHALEALWGLNAIGALDEQMLTAALSHRDAQVRTWAVRLAGDTYGAKLTQPQLDWLNLIAQRERDPQARSQLASTLKRLSAEDALPLIHAMLLNDADAKDVHIPLLLWWAVENKAASARDATVEMASSPDLWKHPLARETVLPRLAHRFIAEPTQDNQLALVKLLKAAPSDADRAVLLGGIREGLVGFDRQKLISPLADALKSSGDTEIALFLGDPAALEQANKIILDESQAADIRVRYIELVGRLAKPETVDNLLKVAGHSKTTPVRSAAISTLGQFDVPDLGKQVIALYPKLSSKAELRAATISMLLARPAWTLSLLAAIDSGAIPRAELGIAQIQRIRQYDDASITALADKLLGKQAKPTSAEKSKEIERVTHLVTSGSGDAESGKQIFTTRCAICHTLFGQGAKVGPDLTGYERRNVDFLVTSVVDPSAYIREEYTAFRIQTRGGQTLIGLVVERGPNQLTVEDAAAQKTVVPKDQIADERALRVSLMPEGLLDGLSEQQVRDLFKYLSSEVSGQKAKH